jgi:hypothetical protein
MISAVKMIHETANINRLMQYRTLAQAITLKMFKNAISGTFIQRNNGMYAMWINIANGIFTEAITYNLEDALSRSLGASRYFLKKVSILINKLWEIFSQGLHP